MARMVALGYGKFVRADRVFAVIPLEADERGDGRRTYVHVEGITEPIVASRSERAILADVEAALAAAGGVPRQRGSAATEKESLGLYPREIDVRRRHDGQRRSRGASA